MATRLSKTPPLLAAALAFTGLAISACSADTTIEPDEESFETEGTEVEQQVNAPAYGVENGTEGGLNLDSGNVPGSPAEIAEDRAEDPPGRYNESLGEPDSYGDE